MFIALNGTCTMYCNLLHHEVPHIVEYAPGPVFCFDTDIRNHMPRQTTPGFDPSDHW